jgi:tripartite-type tricarboxylate transporter receptor subunit TctC
MVDAGKAVSLAVMSSGRNAAFPNIPTLKEAAGIDYSVGAWRGIAAPKGLPADIQTKLVAALKKINEQKEFTEFMAGRGFGVKWADPAGFADFMAKGDAAMKVAMTAAGLAKK